MARLDPHSYNDDSQPETQALTLDATVDFRAKVLHGDVTLHFRAPAAAAGPLDLDTRGLLIDAVEDAHTSTPLPFVVHAAEPILGSRLEITLPAGASAVRIRYRTSPDASALQWLEPSQTSGGRLPFLFSQCQAIHARSIIPLQDTPRLRVRFAAELTVPSTMRAVMAAAHSGRVEDGELATEHFEMPQAIPPYLIAFAVGDLVGKDLSPRCRVWAEPEMIERAAYEFAQVEDMMRVAETLFGPYDWERYDILTMPPSFPYGGMENPRLTFATPTVIAGDRSLVSLVAHELAHSWTGNLVTNANAEHFWLNEGFTVYAERRIVEALSGPDMAALEAALGRRELDAAVARFADRPALTKLRTQLAGIDPDDAYSQVPYEKGAALLTLIESVVTRPRFEAWLRDYLKTFQFKSITTDDFLGHLRGWFDEATLAPVQLERWIDGEGVPPNAPVPSSSRLAAIESLTGGPPPFAAGTLWTPTEWQLYLDGVKRPASADALASLDDRFALTRSENYEVLVAWLTLALESGYHEILPRVDGVLSTVGRMKFLRPLYTALAKDERTRGQAREMFAKYRDRYHPIARQLVEGLLR